MKWTSMQFVLPGLLLFFRVRQSFQCSFSSHFEDNRSYYRQPPANKNPEFGSNCSESIVEPAKQGRIGTAVIWPDEKVTASDPDKDEVSVTAVTSKSSGSNFTEGTTEVIYKAYDGKGGSAYCSFQVIVQVSYCTEVPHLQYGQRKCSGEKENVYGSRCESQCYPGYTLDGAKHVECQENKHWNAPFPTCKPLSCGVPATVEKGQVLCGHGGHVYPQVCSIQCQTGYRYQGAFPFIRCQGDGTWEHLHPCSDVEAPTFLNGCPDDMTLNSGPVGSAVAVNWSDPQTEDNSGQDMELTSSIAPGTELEPGSHTITVTATDATGNSHSCTFRVQIEVWSCPAPQVPSGTVSCSSSYMVGSRCTVTCQKGHRVKDNATTLTCESTDQGEVWKPSDISCEAVQCPVPALSNGRFACPNGHTYTKLCVPLCDPGFQYKGLGYIHCSQNGSWTGFGHCLDVEPPTFPNDCPDNINTFAAALGETTDITWDIPDASDNAGKVQLSSNYQPGSDFPVGVTTVKYTATDESGNVRQCSFTVTVSTLVCDAPDFEAGKSQKWMTHKCPDGSVYGASCSLNCTHGFPLVGPSQVTCNKTDHTYPPTMVWEWTGPRDVQPKCLESSCPKLQKPKNGALKCYLGNFGWDCMMSCQDPYDVPASAGTGHFYCTNSNGFWEPKEVPDCSVKRKPWEARIHGDLFYYADNCEVSLDQLKQNFITRMSNSDRFKDACLNVPACTVDNVHVYCGATVRKRDVHGQINQHQRSRRQSANSPYYVLITYEVPVDISQNDSLSSQEMYQMCEGIRQNLREVMVAEVQNGTFNEDNLYLNPSEAVGDPTMKAVCPSGTTTRESGGQFSCVGCSEGHYLPSPHGTCKSCPLGSYSDIDNATQCTPCPEQHSTVTTAARNSSECLEQCPVGHLSSNGFVPCQPCPAGQYQPGVGSTSCRPCPVNSWTHQAGASSDQECVDADIVLSNSSVSLAFNSGNWSHLSVSLRVGFPDINSNVTVTLQNSEDKADFESITFSAYEAAVDEIKESKRRLFHLFGIDYFVRYPAELPENLLLLLHSDQRRVRISGLAVYGGNLTWEELESQAMNCTVNITSNLLSWSPDPSAVLLPSLCDAVDECSPSPCGDRGVCINLLGGYECQCQDKWSGVHCHLPPDLCQEHQCQNGATCMSAGQNYTCTCPPQFSGDLCELEKVDGGWAEWQAWTPCDCGSQQQQRQRQCTNPSPENGGRPCAGNNTELHACPSSGCGVDEEGVWSGWSPWSSCSASCGGGQRSRQRTCDRVQGTGQVLCQGRDQEEEACQTESCPVHGGWSSWSAWSACSVTCGNGSHSRQRSCDQPVPAYGGDACNGSDTESGACVSLPCPECDDPPRPARSRWSCEVVSQSPYLKTCNFTCLGPYVVVNPTGPFTCGHSTAFLWNHQRKINGSIESKAPTCSRARPLPNPEYNLKLDINTDCDPSRTDQVLKGVRENIDVNIACLQQGYCHTSMTTQCKPSRKRSTPSLRIILKATVGVNITDSDLESNASAWTAYQEVMTVAAESVPDNDTLQSLFTVRLPDGQTVTPDMTSVTSGIEVTCPPGTAVNAMACTDCPVGSQEENGTCVLCPLGFYQDQPASTSCKPCPDGFSWDLPGASALQLCAFKVEEPPPVQPSSTTVPDLGGESLDNGQLVGLVVGCLVVIVIILVVVIVICRRQRGSRQHRSFRPGSPESLQRGVLSKESALPASCDSPRPGHVGRVPPSYEEAIEESLALLPCTGTAPLEGEKGKETADLPEEEGVYTDITYA